MLNAANYPEGLEWVVFASLLVSGLSTILQARPVGPIGAGYPLYMGTSSAFIGVSAAAVATGGLSLLATLVVASSLVQFLFAARLSFFRRMITPTVGGTVIMLIAVNVFPVATDLLSSVPAGFDPTAVSAAFAAFAAFAAITLVSLYARGASRLWAPLIGILVGCIVAAPAGMLNWAPLQNAAWFGLPQTGWPGLDLSFDAQFVGLLLPFMIVGISFWVGLGFQNGAIFPDHLPAWSRGVLDNGMAAGGIVAMVLTLLVSFRQRGQHEVLEPGVRSLSKLNTALNTAAQGAGWDETATNRLQLAGEEAFLYLLERQSESEPRPIRVAVRPVDDVLQIELVSGPDDANLETRLDKLDEEHEIVRDIGARLLRHVAKEVKHEQFYDLDVLTVTVDTRPLV